MVCHSSPASSEFPGALFPIQADLYTSLAGLLHHASGSSPCRQASACTLKLTSSLMSPRTLDHNPKFEYLHQLSLYTKLFQTHLFHLIPSLLTMSSFMMKPLAHRKRPSDPTFAESLTPFSKLQRTMEDRAGVLGRDSQHEKKPKLYKTSKTWPSDNSESNSNVQSNSPPREAGMSRHEIAAASQDKDVKTGKDEAATEKNYSEESSDVGSEQIQTTHSEPNLLGKHSRVQSSSETIGSRTQSSNTPSDINEDIQQATASESLGRKMVKEAEGEHEGSQVGEERSQQTPARQSCSRPPRQAADATPNRQRGYFYNTAFYEGTAASPGSPSNSGNTYCKQDPSADFGNQGLFTPNNLCQSYLPNFNNQGPPFPTPGFMSYGSPTPMSYRPANIGMAQQTPAQSFSSPVPMRPMMAGSYPTPVRNRGMMSSNWRASGPPPTSPALMALAPPFYPAHNMVPALPQTYYGAQGFSKIGGFHAQGMVNQQYGHVVHPAAQAGYPGQPLLGQRQSEPYLTTKRIHFNNYVPSSCTKESDPTLETIRAEASYQPDHSIVSQLQIEGPPPIQGSVLEKWNTVRDMQDGRAETI